MPSPLVQTKLYIPKARSGLVPRPRLSDRLSGTSHPRLTLISAPPGFGKTTLLAAWLDAAAAAERPVAWVSLEESEQQPDSFWTYVVTALDAAAPGVGTAALLLLQAANSPMESVLATVLNDSAPYRRGSTWSSTTTTSPTGRVSRPTWPSCSSTCPGRRTW